MYEPQSTDEHLEELNKVMIKWYKKGHFDNIPNEMYLLKVIADIRQKTGVGDKVMLADLADVLAGLIQNGGTVCGGKIRKFSNSYAESWGFTGVCEKCGGRKTGKITTEEKCKNIFIGQ